MQTRTFLFSDLREYTRFVEHHGDAAAATLIGDYRRIVRAEVARHQGAEVKTEGDSFYVVFDSTTSAVKCAMAVLREADRYSRERPDRPMRIGAGINAGEPQPHEGQYVGEAVIIAARLAQQAGPGELLITETARALIARASVPPLTERTDLVLKGIDHAPRVYAVDRKALGPETPGTAAREEVAVPGAAPQGSITARELIGRETELRALDALLDEAIRGGGKVVLVAGEAGLGKSALMRRFTEAARSHGADVLVGECNEIEARRPFGPLVDAFTAAGMALPPEFRSGPGAQAIAETDRYVVHAAFVTALRERAARTPLVIVLEDVHWADPATLELLQYLPRQVRSTPILVIATYRTDELHRRHPLNQTLAELDRTRLVNEIKLAPLDEDETARLISSALRLDRAPTTEFRRAVHERCGGNAFFTEEVLRALVERGDLQYQDGAWRRSKAVNEIELPRTVRAAVEQRLQQMPERSLRAIRVAAVIGARFSFDLLAEVADYSERDLVAALADAMDAQLIVEDKGARDESYRFRHALTREAVLEEMIARERRLLHGTIAEAIERRAESSTAEHAEELAYHYDEARNAAKALDYRQLAARRALRTGDHIGAAGHLERALELASADDERVPRLYVDLAAALTTVGDLARAREVGEAGLRAAEARGDIRVSGDALSHLATTAFFSGRQDDANAYAARAVELLEPLGPGRELARARTGLAYRAMFQKRPDALDLARRAVEVADAVGEPEARAGALDIMALALVQSSLANAPEGIRLMKDARDIALAAGFYQGAQRAMNNLHVLLAVSGAPRPEVERSVDEHIAFVRERSAFVPTNAVSTAMRRGEWDEALWWIGRRLVGSVWHAGDAIRGSLIEVCRSGPGSSFDPMEQHRKLLLGHQRSPQFVGTATMSAVVHYVAGDDARALADARPLLDSHDMLPALTPMLSALLAARSLGDGGSLEAFLTSAEFYRDHPDRFARILVAFVDGVRAELAGEREAALAAYSRAAGISEEWDEWLAATLIHLERARLLRASGDRAAAAAGIERTLPFWRRVKATWYLGELEKKARELGLELAPAYNVG